MGLESRPASAATLSQDQSEDKTVRLLSVSTSTHLISSNGSPGSGSGSGIEAVSVAAKEPPRDLLSLTVHRLKVIPCAGIVLGLIAGILSSLGAFIVKLLPDINPIEIVVIRSVSHTPSLASRFNPPSLIHASSAPGPRSNWPSTYRSSCARGSRCGEQRVND